MTSQHRTRALVMAAALIAAAWSLWLLLWGLWPHESAAARPAQARFAGRGTTSLRPWWAEARDLAADDSFTFEHKGIAVTVDLAQVRRSHELLVRQPPASRDDTAPRAADPDFNFLSWPRRKFLEEETIKTRKCWVIDFTPPENTGPHCLVRLFVDQKLGALMRMDAFDWSEKRVLSYAVTAGKKVNGELTVKTAEALHYKPGTRKVAAEVEYRLP